MVTTQPPDTPDDPLATLEERIERARVWDEPMEDAQPPGGSAADPLEALRGRIRAAGRVGRAAEPLASLFALIAEAAQAADRPPTLPETDPQADPIEQLHGWMEEERQQLGARGEPLAARRGSGDTSAGGTRPSGAQARDSGSEPLEGVVGREVLAVLENQPLDGPARAEAASQLAELIDALDTLESAELRRRLRDVFGLVVTGDDGTSAR